MKTRYPVIALVAVSLFAACDSPNAPAELVRLSSLAEATVAGTVVTLQLQDVYQLTAKLSGSRSRTTQWSSSAPNVAAVNRTGLVTAVGGGTTVVTASNGLSTETWTIIVRVPQRVEVQTSGSSAMSIGGQASLSAVATDSLGNFTPRLVAWSIDSGTSVAVTSAGLLTAVRNGSSIVAATVSGTVGRLRVVVGSPATATSMSLQPGTVVLAPNGQVQFTPTVLWSDGTTSSPSVTYSAAGGSISSGGLYTAGAQSGSFSISASCTCGVTATASVTIEGNSPPPVGIVQPTLPTEYVPPAAVKTGATIRVPAGGDLQAALDAAQPGDEIVLADGATFTGNYRLPAKSSGTGWITVRGETIRPQPGNRTSPTLWSGGASVITPNSEPAIITLAGAKRWRLSGFRVTQVSGLEINYGLIVLGNGETTRSAVPSNIVIDRMYITGPVNDNSKRCVTMNADSVAVIDSYIAECHGRGFDAQAIAAWSGGGPFLIQNNFLEGSANTVIFGGADANIRNLTPSDIVIRRNYFFRPDSWSGGRWTVKNHLEFKHAARVLVEGNVFENSWADGQQGYHVVIMTASDNNTAWDWVRTQDITIVNNQFRRAMGGMQITARYATGGYTVPVNAVSRLLVKNNLFLDVGVDPFQGFDGRLFQLVGDLRDVSIQNNTFVGSSTGNVIPRTVLTVGGAAPQANLTVTGNVFTASSYGVIGDATGVGSASLDRFAPNATFRDNLVPLQPGDRYPAGNQFPESLSELIFESPATGNYALSPLSRYFAGSRIGIDFSKLGPAIAGVR